MPTQPTAQQIHSDKQNIQRMIGIQCKTRRVLILWMSLCLLVGGITGYAQPAGKTGVKCGVEFGEYLSTHSGSFRKEPGFIFGLHTGVGLFTDPVNSFSLGIEFNFNKIIRYKSGDEFLYPYEYRLYRFVFDKRFVVSFFEVGLLPAFFHSLNEASGIGLYVGPSLGIGTEHLTTREQSRIVIVTLNYPGAMYYPYGEYNIGNVRGTACLNIGISYWYHSLMLEVRFRYTHIGSRGEVDDFRNSYIQLGFAL